MSSQRFPFPHLAFSLQVNDDKKNVLVLIRCPLRAAFIYLFPTVTPD